MENRNAHWNLEDYIRMHWNSMWNLVHPVSFYKPTQIEHHGGMISITVMGFSGEAATMRFMMIQFIYQSYLGCIISDSNYSSFS